MLVKDLQCLVYWQEAESESMKRSTNANPDWWLSSTQDEAKLYENYCTSNKANLSSRRTS